MKTRILVATAAFATLGLLSACVENGAGNATSGGAPVSGAEACVREVEAQSGSSGVTVVSDSNPGGAGIVNLNAPGTGPWTCFTTASGGVASVSADDQMSRR